MSWLARFHDAEAELASGSADPWHVRLERIRGKIGSDGIERISTQQLLDILEVFQRDRTAGACRRLSKLMVELGWSPVRLRDLSHGRYIENIRGYARRPRP